MQSRVESSRVKYFAATARRRRRTHMLDMPIVQDCQRQPCRRIEQQNQSAELTCEPGLLIPVRCQSCLFMEVRLYP
jgi:hypothetical protein